MIYAKGALTLEQQADQLIARGLVAGRNELIGRLKVVNYYRLSGYLYPFRQPDETLRPGTTLDMVWRRYNFDRRLRIILLDAIVATSAVPARYSPSCVLYKSSSPCGR